MIADEQSDQELPDESLVSKPIAATVDVPHDSYAALRFRDFKLMISGRFVASLGEQMVSVAVGWELYERTHDPLALGLVGLVQILPVIFLSLLAGHVADRFKRKNVLLITQLLLAVSSLGLAVLSFSHGSLVLVYTCLLGIGVARAFNGPASSAFFPQTVPQYAFANAATWSSSSWQLAAMLGPALGGFLIAVQQSAGLVYVLDAVAAVLFMVFVLLIKGRPIAIAKERATMESLTAGARFIWRSKILMAAITLDLFAVLLGGATTLLPVYAKDILQVGPTGLGWLRAAPSIGAVIMALVLAHQPPFRQSGKVLLFAVAGFGVATIIFGLSQSFVLSMLMLAALGALDNISVVIRSTLLLIRTPDEMRGRISAVNSVFVGASNELGGFESGVVARLLGPVISVVAGGVGTILVVIVVALLWPEIRQLQRLVEG